MLRRVCSRCWLDVYKRQEYVKPAADQQDQYCDCHIFAFFGLCQTPYEGSAKIVILDLMYLYSCIYVFYGCAKKRSRLIKTISLLSQNERPWRLFQPVVLQFSVECGQSDAQKTGCFGFVALRIFQYPDYMAVFQRCLLYTSRCV